MRIELLWDLFGLQPGASQEEIKKVYRHMSRSLHPDVNKSPSAEHMMRVLNLAYEALTAEGGGHTGRYRAPDRDDDIFDEEDVNDFGSDWAKEKWCDCRLCSYEMPIGKYKYESIEWIWFNDPQYVQWCIREFEADSYVRRRLIMMIEHKGVDWKSWSQGRRAR